MTKNVQQTPFSKDLANDLFISPAFTEEEAERIQERMKEMSLHIRSQHKAKYKLEVAFITDRSHHRPFAGIVTFWENANKIHGGGDTKLYLCPRSDCEAVIPDSANTTTFLVCAKCGGLWKPEQVCGEIFYRLPIELWADVLLKWFTTKMEFDADVRIKYARDDIRHATRLELDKNRGGELLGKVRNEDRRTSSIYRLTSIIKDTSAGADLRGRLLAFLKA